MLPYIFGFKRCTLILAIGRRKRQTSTEDQFAAMDKDGDRKVSLDELIAYGKLELPEEMLNVTKIWDQYEEKFSVTGRETFDQADKNGDGFLELEERMEAEKTIK